MLEVVKSDAPIVVRKSTCGNFIRVTIGTREVEMTIGEWSHLIMKPGTYRRQDAK